MSENKKVSQLENMLPPNGTEYLMIIQENEGNNQSKKVSLDNLIEYINQANADRIFTKKITITSEQLLTIGTYPIELVEAPGIGRKIELVNVSSSFNSGGNPYGVTGGIYGIIYRNDYEADLGVVIAEIKGSSNIPLSEMRPFCNWVITSSYDVDSYGGNSFSLSPENQAIVLSTDDRTSAESGDGTLTMYITYKIISL